MFVSPSFSFSFFSLLGDIGQKIRESSSKKCQKGRKTTRVFPFCENTFLFVFFLFWLLQVRSGYFRAGRTRGGKLF